MTVFQSFYLQDKLSVFFLINFKKVIVMKIFMVSFFVSFSSLVFIFSPVVELAPVDIAPRILFYLSFIVAICLSFCFIIIEHAVSQIHDMASEKQLAV